MNKSINIKIDDVKPLVYFIISMFEQETVHRQGTSSKSDLIGGYLDRWINRIPESLIFNNFLLKNKPYKVVNDYFIYSAKSAKNAPDVIGLKNYEGNIIKFAEFADDIWESCRGMPYIEVKTFRQAQKMLSVRKPQMDPEHYYIIVESDLKANYLKALFDSSFFKDSIHDNILMDDIFIKSGSKGKLIQPPQIKKFKKTETIGTLKLLSIIKGQDLIDMANLCKEKETVYYVKNIKEVDKIKNANKDICIKDYFKYDKNKKLCKKKNWVDEKQLIHIQVKKAKNIIVRKINKGSFYIETKDKCSLDGTELKGSKKYKIELEKFERSSSWMEYIAHKNTFYKNIDRTEELINKFDNIYKKHADA